MARLEDPIFCKNCGIEITWSPVIDHGQHYCCQDCHDGFQCDCAERMELVDDRHYRSYYSQIDSQGNLS